MSYQDRNSLEKAIKSRILMINEDIKNNLTSLSLEDNFDTEEVKLYYESNEKAIQYIQTNEGLEITLNDYKDDVTADISAMAGQISLKVKKGNVVTELNAESTGLYFSSKLFLVDTENFKVTADSCYAKGTIYASKADIAGWTFSNGSAVGSSSSVISGGEIHAAAAECSIVEAVDMDLNPDHENTYHVINMKNATLIGDISSEGSNMPNFSDISSYGSIELSGNLYVDEVLHCTSLRAQGTSGYISIYCEEIVTEEESWSDARLKENIRDITDNEAAVIFKLRPVSYILKKNRRPGAGLIAQELLGEIKNLGFDTIVGMEKGYYFVAYRQLIPLMIKAVQSNYERLKGKIR